MKAITNELTPMNGGFMDHIFQKVEKGKCRIALNGQIAIWTSNGYKTFSLKNGTLTNCNSFVAQFGDDYFYVVPAARVKPGDIILVNGTPRCVMKAEKNLLTVMTYETGAVETIIPERHMFMGSIYFYHKIMTPMLGMFGTKKGKANRMLKMMMMSDMMKPGGNNGTGGNMGFMQMLMMQGLMKDMGNSMEDMFDGFDNDDDAADTVDTVGADDEDDLF